MDLPDTRHLLHAYGLARDAPPHLSALSGSDAEAIAKAGDYLCSAIIHQGTPWPATGTIASYVCSLVADGTLSEAAQPCVQEFLDEVLAAVELAQEEGGPEWLREQIASSTFDVDAAIADMAQLSDADAEVAYEKLFENDDIADLIMYVAFLGIVEREDELRTAKELLAKP
jgi:hypothetical protein